MNARSIPRSLIALVTLPLVACFGDDPSSPLAPPPPHDPSNPGAVFSLSEVCGEQTFDLIAGQSMTVGTVRVANDGEILQVRFETSDPWAMAATHVAVAEDVAGVPTVRDRIAPGQFPEGALHDPAVTTYEHEFDLSAFGDAATLVVAAYAKATDGGTTEGAWIEGDPFVERGSWASYATYDVGECDGDGGSTETIGSDGGIATFEDASIEIPAGALSSDVDITIEPLADDVFPEALPGTTYDFSPDDQMFDVDVTISIQYDPTGMSLEDEEKLAIHRLEGGIRVALPSTVDTDANVVSAQTTHFSVYAVAPGVLRMELRAVPDTFAGEGALFEHVVSIRNLGASVIPGGDVTIVFTLVGDVDDEPFGYNSLSCSLVFDPTPPETRQYTCTLFADVTPGGPAIALDFRHRAPIGSAGDTVQASASFAYDGWAGSVAAPRFRFFEELLTDVWVEAYAGSLIFEDTADIEVALTNLGPRTLYSAEIQVDLQGVLDPAEIVAPPFCSFFHTLDSDGDAVDDGASYHCRTNFAVGSGFSVLFFFTVRPRAAIGSSPLEVLTQVSKILGTTDPVAANDFFFNGFPVDP
ncbi:MAG TPA: hypothetical protein VK837_05650 [Longimicrobiales bacterium]|nr:hypothetical protein [Longimicrobiales bacterium]